MYIEMIENFEPLIKKASTLKIECPDGCGVIIPQINHEVNKYIDRLTGKLSVYVSAQCDSCNEWFEVVHGTENNGKWDIEVEV